ncbi:MAG: hypothetical protein ACE15C_03180 [Phycisphaerae bacterium]
MPVERPTFSESWYRVAEMRPRLRPAVQVQRQYFRGQIWHVVQDPSNNQFFRLTDNAYRLVAMLDGRRTVAEVWNICNEQLGDGAPTQGETIQLLGQLYVSNLLLSEVPPDAKGLFERYKKRVGREVRGYLANLLFIRIPLLDPDHFLNRWVGLLGWMFTVPGLLIWCVFLAVGLHATMGHFGELWQSARSLMGPGEGILSKNNLWILYLCFVGVKIIHEFSHAFACKKFGRAEGTGGEVHAMGIMFLIFTPIPYVDASSSWALRSKWRRIVVAAAGVMVELVIASIAAVVWANTAPGAIIHKVAYNIMFIAGVSTILFNGNPLLRYDGYYALSDLLEIPNLAQRSKQYIYYLVRKHVWGVRQIQNPAHTGGEKVWMIFYGVASTIYRVFICVVILLFVANQLLVLGVVLAAAAVVAWVLVPLGKFVHYLFTSGELMRVRGRAMASTAGTFVAIFAVIGLALFADRSRLDSIVDSAHRAEVYMQSSGFIEADSILPSGTKVEKGDVLLRARNRELELKQAELTAQANCLEVERKAALGKASPKDVQDIEGRIAAVNFHLKWVNTQLADLTVRAPIAGTWISPDVEMFKGAFVAKGKPIGEIADLDNLVIKAVSPQDVPLTGVRRQGVEIRAWGRPPEMGKSDAAMTGTIVEIPAATTDRLPSPALSIAAGGNIETAPDDPHGLKAAEPFYEIRIIPDRKGELMLGQRVVVRISRPDRPLALQWWHSLLQLKQRRFQS